MKQIRIGRQAQKGQLKQVELVVQSYLKKYTDVSVVVKKFSENKTQQQLRLYHGFWVNEAAEFTGNMDIASVHRDLKEQHLRPILIVKREGFAELVDLLVNSLGNVDESNRLYALYVREMSLGSATKEEVMLYMSALKHFFIHEWQWHGFTEPSMRGLV